MSAYTSAGTKIFIGPVVADTINSLAALKALNYTEIGEVEDIGAYGDSANEITFTALGNRRVRKFKGSFNAGTFNITCAFDGGDDGQEALKEAFDSDQDFAFKIVANDGSEGSPSQNSTDYFRGKVMSRTKNIGNAENVTRGEFAIAINSAVFTEARA